MQRVMFAHYSLSISTQRLDLLKVPKASDKKR